LKEEIGLGNVQSRFKEDVNKVVVLEEVKPVEKKSAKKRGNSSTAMLKSLTSTSNFAD